MFTEMNSYETMDINGGVNGLQIIGGVLVVIGSIAACGSGAVAAVVGVAGGIGMILDGFK